MKRIAKEKKREVAQHQQWLSAARKLALAA